MQFGVNNSTLCDDNSLLPTAPVKALEGVFQTSQTLLLMLLRELYIHPLYYAPLEEWRDRQMENDVQESTMELA